MLPLVGRGCYPSSKRPPTGVKSTRTSPSPAHARKAPASLDRPLGDSLTKETTIGPSDSVADFSPTGRGRGDAERCCSGRNTRPALRDCRRSLSATRTRRRQGWKRSTARSVKERQDRSQDGARLLAPLQPSLDQLGTPRRPTTAWSYVTVGHKVTVGATSLRADASAEAASVSARRSAGCPEAELQRNARGSTARFRSNSARERIGHLRAPALAIPRKRPPGGPSASRSSVAAVAAAAPPRLLGSAPIVGALRRSSRRAAELRTGRDLRPCRTAPCRVLRRGTSAPRPRRRAW